MNVIELEPPVAAPMLSLVQLACLAQAAADIEHPVAWMVQLALLAPGIADLLPLADVSHVDAALGTVLVPITRGRLHEVALGSRALALILDLLDGRASGPLLADVHGDPIHADADASDFARELLADVAPETAEFDWCLPSIQLSALAHVSAGGVSPALIASACAEWPIPRDADIRRRMIIEQVMVAEYWTSLLSGSAIPGSNRVGSWSEARDRDASFAAFAIAGRTS